MKRPIVFAIELLLGLALAAAGAWVAERFSRKANRQAQAAERIAAALERAYPAPKPLPRPSLAVEMDAERDAALLGCQKDSPREWSCNHLATLGGTAVDE